MEMSQNAAGQARSPLRQDLNPSLTIAQGDDGTCLVRDHGAPDRQRELLNAIRERYGVTLYSRHRQPASNQNLAPVPESAPLELYIDEDVAPHVPLKVDGMLIRALYHYRLGNEIAVALTVARFEDENGGKTIRPFHMKNSAIVQGWPTERPLYRADLLGRRRRRRKPVLVVEGVADAFPEGFSREDLDQRLATAPEFSPESVVLAKRNVRSLGSILTTEFRPVNWCVENMIPEGVTLLVGKPKVGKSWFCLQLCNSVASGGFFLGRPCQSGNVLYLALEDTDRRLQERASLLGINGNHSIEVETEWSGLGSGGLEELEAWIKTKSNPRLIIIDTLVKVRPPVASNKSLYEQDYEASRQLKALAEKYNVAIVVVHHKSKRSAEDQLDEASGSTGLTGGVDSVLTLSPKKKRHRHGVLYGRGRDLPQDTPLPSPDFLPLWGCMVNLSDPGGQTTASTALSTSWRIFCHS